MLPQAGRAWAARPAQHSLPGSRLVMPNPMLSPLPHQPSCRLVLHAAGGRGGEGSGVADGHPAGGQALACSAFVGMAQRAKGAGTALLAGLSSSCPALRLSPAAALRTHHPFQGRALRRGPDGDDAAARGGSVRADGGECSPQSLAAALGCCCWPWMCRWVGGLAVLAQQHSPPRAGHSGSYVSAFALGTQRNT